MSVRADKLKFFKQFIKNPLEVGSIVPSSSALALAMLGDIDLGRLDCIVEYGPGTGSFTRHLFARKRPDCRYIAIEPNVAFRRHLEDSFPGIEVVEDRAEHLLRHLPELAGNVDLVVSGLPFSLMPWQSVEQTLLETIQLLKNGGCFRTFVYHHTYYLPKIRLLRQRLYADYAHVAKKSVFSNVPPAIVIKCVK